MIRIHIKVQKLEAVKAQNGALDGVDAKSGGMEDLYNILISWLQNRIPWR
jgi:hypothetical protein